MPATALLQILRPGSALRALASLILFVALVSPLRADEGSWTPIGPDGGSVRALAVSAADHALYAGSDLGVLFRSADAGASWTILGTKTYGSGSFLDILVDPSDPRVLYLRYDTEPSQPPYEFSILAQLSKSTDSGATWHPIGPGENIVSFVMAPSNPHVLYAGGKSDVFRSIDGGGSWLASSLGKQAYGLAVDPGDAGTVYASTAEGIRKSIDGGMTWSPAAASFFAPALAIDPTHRSTIYAGGARIWKSIDGGASWSPSDSGLAPDNNTQVLALLIDPSAPATLLASVMRRQGNFFTRTGEIWKSTDGGATWRRVLSTPVLRVIDKLALDPASPSRIVAATELSGILVSDDRGETWAPSNRGLRATAVGALAASPGADGTLLASTQLGLFRSADLGEHWAQVLGRTPYTLVFHPLQPGTVYAGAIDGLYKSTDSGRTWQIAQGTGAPLSLWSTLAIDPINPKFLYALGRRRNGPLDVAGGARSTDGGATWIDMTIDSAVAYSITLDPRQPARLYASTSRGLYRSTDRGRTWQPLTEGIPSHEPGLWPSFEILVDPDQPDLVWAAQKTYRFGLLKSEDAGVHWQPVDGTGIPESAVVQSLVKPPLSGVLYASTTAGVYRSAAGGDTWLPWMDGLVVPANRLAVDPRNPSRLYAGTNGGGVFTRSTAPTTCETRADALCLTGGRFLVDVAWRLPDGRSGMGQALPLGGETGGFWFFSPSNLELLVKVLDGRALNGNFWVFYGALSDVEYTVRVTDTVTGETRLYRNPAGRLASVADTAAFPAAGTSAITATDSPATTLAAADCGTAPGSALCLQDARFQVEVAWKDFAGHTGQGQAVPLTGDSGYFWFFGSGNIELMVKVLDGRSVNNHFWVFYGALSTVEYTITVTDRTTGARKTYVNPSGHLASAADTTAF